MKKILLILLSLMLASTVFAGQTSEKKEIEGQLKRIWGEMNAKLTAGDIEGALAFFVEANRDKYRKTFAGMEKDALVSFFSKSEITVNDLRDDMAECLVVPGGDGVQFSYPVSFRRTANNEWKIYDF
jgi:hypothetical protein